MPDKTTISGGVFGEPPTYNPSAATTNAPVPATIVCNGASAQPSSSGKFILRIVPAQQYVCVVAA